MPADWASSVAIPIFRGKEYIMNYDMLRGVNLLERAIKIVEKLFEKGLIKVVTIDDMQFGYMPGKGTFDAVFIL